MNKEKGPVDRMLARWDGELRSTWEALPKKTRAELEKITKQLPGGLKGWRDLIDHAVRQAQFASGTKRRVSILGPANAGKSTLYNALIRPNEAPAEVSAIPGTTRTVGEGDAGLFRLLDTPGADAAGGLGAEHRQRAIEAAANSDVIVALFDATHGIRNPERDIFDELVALDIPMVVALNKMDLVRKEQPAVLGRAAAALGVEADRVLPISALKREGLERLLRNIAEREPALVAALGAALPAYRWSLSQAVIAKAASAAGAIGVTPLPFLDFIPLVGVQTSMVLAIARIYARRVSLSMVREMLATLGIGALGRMLFYELSKLGGPPTWLLAAAVAAGTTAALGYGAATWFERDERLTAQRLRAVSKAFSQAIVQRLRSFGRRKPGQASLREQIAQAIQALPAPEGAGTGMPEAQGSAARPGLEDQPR